MSTPDLSAPRFGPSRGEEWALQELITRSRALVLISGTLHQLGANALPEELVHDLLPELVAIRSLLEDLHQELREEITAYRAARDGLEGDLDGL